MRQLTATQKKVLDKTLTKFNKRDMLGELNFQIYTYEDLPSEVWEQLEKINDTEILHTETNRFIGDFNSKLTYNH